MNRTDEASLPPADLVRHLSIASRTVGSGNPLFSTAFSFMAVRDAAAANAAGAQQFELRGMPFVEAAFEARSAASSRLILSPHAAATGVARG